jgi:hypothetical protein
MSAEELWPRLIVTGYMAPMDDIKGGTSASEAAASSPAQAGPRSIGPESESRGGAEAPDTTLTGDDSAAPQTKPDRLPGQRADLPPGSLPGPHLGPQGDENRTPPPNAPSPIKPAVTVASPARDRDRGNADQDVGRSKTKAANER